MKKSGLVVLLLLKWQLFFAEIPALEREISLSLVNEHISNVLIKIQEQTGVIFSYQTSILSEIEPVTLQLKRKTVREALALMLPKTIAYKVKTNYIILKVKPLEQNARKTEISGYVYDKKTEEKLANVTIYNKESLQSVTTNDYGYYSISLPGNTDKLSINKENYQDTTLSIKEVKENKINNITIEPLAASQSNRDSLALKDYLRSVGIYTNEMYRRVKGFVNTINVKDTITRSFQVSLFPFVGTNHKLSGNVVNKLSFNIYGGFAKGVNGFEMGGIFNLDRQNVKGVQLAGIFNVVGDSVTGTQLAGCFNVTGKSMQGFQGAGLMNINEGVQRGVQLAALLNLNDKRSTGVSLAGLMNLNTYKDGFQAAALGNLSDTLKGHSIAGLFNMSDFSDESVEIAGLFNDQKSGNSNIQIAALYNSTHHLKGIQIALFNFSDTCSGIPLGLFSFVKKGLHQIELNTDEIFEANVSLRTGTRAFYNILSIGIQPGMGKKFWQLGYGAGTSFKISNRWRSDITLSTHHVSHGGFYNGTSELYKLYWGVEYRVSGKFTVAFGPTYNLYVSDALLPDFQTYQSLVPYSLFESTNPYDFNMKGWLGGRFALRFL